MPVSTSNKKKVLQMLQRRHPDYIGKLPHWTFLRKTYEGGRNWFYDNIFRYLKEGDQEYMDRLKRAYRFNHTREIVDLVQKYIFKTEPARNVTDAPAAIKTFWEDCTLAGLEINQFMRLVSTASSIDGRIWVFVDSTQSQVGVSVADAKKAGARVYAYIVRAINMLDMGLDEDTGALKWVLVREYHRNDADPVNDNGFVEERYRLWTEDEWVLFKIVDISKEQQQQLQLVQPSALEANPNISAYVTQQTSMTQQTLTPKVIDRGPVTIGRVPCFAVDNVIGDHRYSSPALIEDIAYLDRAVANYCSNLDAVIQDQTFSQLVIPTQAIVEGQDKYDPLYQLGTKRIFTYDAEGGRAPEYISPDASQAKVIMDTIAATIHEIYHSVGMAGERTSKDNAVGTDDSSGVAKAYDFEKLNSLLTTKAEANENAENKLVELVLLMNGIKEMPTEELVEYPDTFDVRSLFDEFTVAEKLELIGAPDTVRRVQMGQVQAKLFPAQPKAEAAEMAEELKSWPPEPLEITLATMSAANGSPPQGSIKNAPASSSAPGGKPAASRNPQTKNRQGQVTSETK